MSWEKLGQGADGNVFQVLSSEMQLWEVGHKMRTSEARIYIYINTHFTDWC